MLVLTLMFLFLVMPNSSTQGYLAGGQTELKDFSQDPDAQLVWGKTKEKYSDQVLNGLNIARLEEPKEFQTQVVAGVKYYFRFADGNTMTVFYQSWTNTLEISSINQDIPILTGTFHKIVFHAQPENLCQDSVVASTGRTCDDHISEAGPTSMTIDTFCSLYGEDCCDTCSNKRYCSIPGQEYMLCGNLNEPICGKDAFFGMFGFSLRCNIGCQCPRNQFLDTASNSCVQNCPKTEEKKTCECGTTCIKQGDMAGQFDKDCNCRLDWWKYDSLCLPINEGSIKNNVEKLNPSIDPSITPLPGSTNNQKKNEKSAGEKKLTLSSQNIEESTGSSGILDSNTQLGFIIAGVGIPTFCATMLLHYNVYMRFCGKQKRFYTFDDE